MRQPQSFRSIRCAAALCALLASGAALPEDVTPRSDFGDSVRHMIQQQIYDPAAAARPSTDPPAGIDGERAAAALRMYRGAGAAPATPMDGELPIQVSP